MVRGTVYFVMEKTARSTAWKVAFLVNECLETKDGKAKFIIDNVLYS
jgi:hypothetical protein